MGESRTTGPQEGLSSLRLTFFFLKAAPPASSLPAFLLLESAMIISAVVPGELCSAMSLSGRACREISMPPMWPGTGAAGLNPDSKHPRADRGRADGGWGRVVTSRLEAQASQRPTTLLIVQRSACVN